MIHSRFTEFLTRQLEVTGTKDKDLRLCVCHLIALIIDSHGQ